MIPQVKYLPEWMGGRERTNLPVGRDPIDLSSFGFII